MIIQCEQCRTKFKLDDAKVKDKGVKVRCAKCRNVFTVTRDQQSATQPDFAAVLEQHGDMPQAVAPVSFELEQGDETVRQDAAPVSFELEQGSDAFPASTAPVSFEFEQAGAASQDDTPVSFELEQNQDAFPASTTPVSFELEQSGDAPQDSAPVSFELEQDQQPAGPESKEFEFDDSSFPADEPPAADAGGSFELPAQDVAPASPEDDFDLSSLAWSDDLKPEDGGVSDEKIDFSDTFGEEPPAASDKTMVASSVFAGIEDMTMVQSRASSAKPDLGQFSASVDEKVGTAVGGQEHAADSFVLGDIDFGDTLEVSAEHPVNPDQPAGGHDFVFEPLEEGGEGKAWNVDEGGDKSDAAAVQPPHEDDMPPLPIASRRKQSTMLIAVLGVVVLAIAGVVSYFGLSMFTGDEKPVASEVGRISLRAVSASYVKHATAGEMLVISGEALNSYSVPRAAIQIKGAVYGAGGQVLVSKNAFAGNVISKEQLATMPVEKIEAAMANQFGDSLSNMEVPPGKAIPFVVVITNLPADARDYGVELVGSTVSTGKK